MVITYLVSSDAKAALLSIMLTLGVRFLNELWIVGITSKMLKTVTLRSTQNVTRYTVIPFWILYMLLNMGIRWRALDDIWIVGPVFVPGVDVIICCWCLYWCCSWTIFTNWCSIDVTHGHVMETPLVLLLINYLSEYQTCRTGCLVVNTRVTFAWQ